MQEFCSLHLLQFQPIDQAVSLSDLVKSTTSNSVTFTDGSNISSIRQLLYCNRFKWKRRVVLSVSLVFGLAGSSFADGNPEAKVITSSSETNKPLYTSDGELLGSVETKTEVTITNQENEKTSFTVTKNNDYDLEQKFAEIPEYQERFSDGIETATYEIIDNKIYKDGIVIMDGSEENQNVSTFSVNGGIPAMSHYYSNSNLSSYVFGTYSHIKFNAFEWNYYMSPSGSHASKTVSPYNVYFNSAKSAMDDFEGSNTNYVLGIGSFLVASGTAVLTWASIIGAITGGGAAAVAAGVVVNEFNNCQDDIADAYAYVNAM